MTTAEIKDAAIFIMAYSFLKMDSTANLESGLIPK